MESYKIAGKLEEILVRGEKNDYEEDWYRDQIEMLRLHLVDEDTRMSETYYRDEDKNITLSPLKIRTSEEFKAHVKKLLAPYDDSED